MGLLFDKEVAELKARGISLSDLTADEIVDLVHAVDRMKNPFRNLNCEAVGFPVVLSDGTMLYNLTIGATVWLDEFAGVWWASGSKAYFWAMVYALIHARDKDAFTGELQDRDSARQAIVQTAVRIKLTEDELLEGIERVIHKRNDASADTLNSEQSTDWSVIVQTLELATGIPAETWVWGKSADWCVSEFHRHRRFAESMKGKSLPRMKDDLDRATNALASVRSAIIKRLERTAGNE